MKRISRVFLFLLLNVLISACTTLAILIAWDRTRAPLPGGIIPPIAQLIRPAAQATITPTPANTAIPNPTATPAFIVYQVQSGDTFDSLASNNGVSVEELLAANGFNQNQVLGVGETLRIPVRVVNIESVVGVGDLESERVVIRSNLAEQLSLSGWILEDQDGYQYRFPEVILFVRGGSLNIYSKKGGNTVTDLFWGLDGPTWQSGELVQLRDATNELRAAYTIP